MKKVTLLYPGEMGEALGAALAAHGCDVFTWLGERSEATRARARRAGCVALASFETAVAAADAVISLVPPGEAVGLARRFAACAGPTPPLYLDANSLSPRAMREIEACVGAAGAACVDGALVGGAARIGSGTVWLLSGPRAAELEAAWRGALELRVLGGRVGSASELKLAFAAFNKGLVALFLETVSAGGCAGRAAELLQLLADFYPGSVETVARLLPSYPRHVARRVQEMGEVETWLGDLGHSSAMARGARLTFERLLVAGLDPEQSWPFGRVLDEVLRREVLSGPAAPAERMNGGGRPSAPPAAATTIDRGDADDVR